MVALLFCHNTATLWVKTISWTSAETLGFAIFCCLLYV